MKYSIGLNTWGALLVGFLVWFVLFLKRGKKQISNLNLRPINQDWMGSKRLALLPYIDAQARHETGDFTSRLAVELNNLFGMKRPVIRPFFGSGGQVGQFAEYENYRQSVQDLMAWMDYTGFPLAVSGSAQYVAELKKRGYFEDSQQNYLNGVNRGLAALENEGFKGFKITYL